jgi:hypothetical protein
MNNELKLTRSIRGPMDPTIHSSGYSNKIMIYHHSNVKYKILVIALTRIQGVKGEAGLTDVSKPP